MAKFEITHIDETGFAWEITGLNYSWSYSSYYYAGVRTTAFISGTDVINSDTLDYMPWGGMAISFGSTTMISSSICYSWTPSTKYGTTPFYIYPWVEEVATSLTWAIGENGTVPAGNLAEAILVTPAGSVPRPSYFYWSNYGTEYSPQNRTQVGGKWSIYRPVYQAWNAFRQNVIAMLVYKGILPNSSYFQYYTHYFGLVNRYAPISYSLYNKAASCINAMGGSVPYANSLTKCTENYFYYLQHYLNLIS